MRPVRHKTPSPEPRSAVRAPRPASGLRLAGPLLLLAASACTPALEVAPRHLDGTFRGTSPSGEPLIVTFAEEDQAFRGTGTVAGRPIVLAGPVVWRGVGALVQGDGGTRPVELSLSADGERLEMVELAGPPGEPVRLERGGASGAPAGSASGAFTGAYRAERGPGTLARVRLVQSGSLIAGSGAILGEPVGIAGRLVSASRAEGTVLFPDGSEVAFAAERAASGETLRLTGFGDPMTLTEEDRR